MSRNVLDVFANDPGPPEERAAFQRWIGVTTMAHQLNATTTKATTCTCCKRALAAGVRVAVFRERATCSAEARNAGTLYPKRRWCVSCAVMVKHRVERLPGGSDVSEVADPSLRLAYKPSDVELDAERMPVQPLALVARMPPSAEDAAE